MSKKIIAIILAFALVVGSASFLYFRKSPTEDISLDELLAPPAAADYYEESNKLKLSKGTATVTRATGEEETISDETVVNVGDTISVNEDSAATLYWFDDSISRLQAGTQLTIDKADYNPDNITETDINFNLIKGEVWSKVRNLVDEESEFLSYSGNVVAGVRGSVYNMIVSDEEVNVESIQHAAFVAEVDPETKKPKNPQFIARGKQANVKGDKININQIPDERWEQDWYQKNKKEDKKAAKQLGVKNTKRLIERAGILPGEKGYDRKMKLIEKRLKQVKNPKKRTELEARIAQMKANEAIALMVQGGNIDSKAISEKLLEVQKIINSKNIEVNVQKQLHDQAMTILRSLDRDMEHILPNEDLYSVKEMLREQQMEMTSPDKRDELHKKFIERKLYELSDAANEGMLSPERLKEEFQRYREEVGEFDEFLNSNPDFRNIAAQIMKNLEGLEGIDMNSPELKELMNFFESGEFEIAIKEAEKIIETLPDMSELDRIQKEAEAELNRLQEEIKTITPPTDTIIPAEDPDLVKDEAPFYAGPSDV